MLHYHDRVVAEATLRMSLQITTSTATEKFFPKEKLFAVRRADARPNNKLVLRPVFTQNRGLLLNFMKFRGTSPIADRSSAAISASDKFPHKLHKVKKFIGRSTSKDKLLFFSYADPNKINGRHFPI